MSLRRRLARLLPRDVFLKRVAMLSGGVMLGQIILVAALPLLTRLYTPEQFGVLALFMALTTIIGTVICLCYEFAVPVVPERDDAATLVAVAGTVATALAAIVMVVVALFRHGVAALLGTEELAPFLWLVPLAMLLHGLAVPLGGWFLRHGVFKRAVNKPLQFSPQVAAQIGLGLAGAGTAGLVAGYCAGYAARFVYLLGSLPRPDRRLLLRLQPRRMWRLAREHWVYPALSTPSYLLQSSTQMLPAVFLAMLYGPAAAGWFGLAQRMLELPVRLLSQSTSSVYLHAIARGDAAEVYRLFRRTSLRFLILGLLGMAPLLLAGPWLFALIFGEEWRVAGTMVQCLVPAQLARFVVVPVAQTLNVFRRQDLHLRAAGLNLLALVASFLAGWWLQLGPTLVVLLFSLASSLAWLAYYLFAWQVARERARQAIGSEAPAADRPVSPVDAD